MITPTFDKEALMRALHKAVEYFNVENDPTASVVKAAEEFDFNPEQATRLVETFNTARTIYHYKTADDRTAEFPLADSAAVIVSLFGVDEKTEKKAKASDSGLHDYSCYEIPEAHFEQSLDVQSGGTLDPGAGEVKQFNDTTLDALSSRAYKVLRVQRDLANTCRDEAGIAETKAAQLLGDVANYVKLGFIEDAEDKFTRLCYSFKDKTDYDPVMAKLGTFVQERLYPTEEKLASCGPFVDAADIQPQICQVKEAKQWMETEAEMLALAGVLDKEADDFDREFLEIVSPLFPKKRAFVDTIARFVNPNLVGEAVKLAAYGDNDDADADKKKSKKPAGKGTSMMPDIVREGVKKPTTSFIETGLQAAIAAPRERENVQLSDRLKNVQRQLMLEDLIVNDPVLSEEKPEIIGNAYEAILRLAPELATNKEVVRAILRQAVHSVAVGPYEAQTWLQLEQNIANLAGKARGQQSGAAR